jgi:spermidine/putrescine transport system permease protein
VEFRTRGGDETVKYQETGAKKKLGPFLTISPIIIWLLCFLVIPLFLVVLVSFMTRGQYGNIEYKFTFENYTQMFDSLYYEILFKSLFMSLVTTAICLLLGYPFAYFVARFPKKYQSFLMMLIIVPFWTNSLVRTYAWIILLRSEGIINSYLIKFGLIRHPFEILGTNTSLIIGMVYTLFPFMVLPLYSSIEKLDKNYLEAANDLGANPIKVFTKITLPLTMPGIIAGSLLVFMPTLGYFFIPDLMGGGKTMYISNLIKNQFLGTAMNWPFGSAVSIVLIIISILLIGGYVKIVGTNNKNTEVF